MIKQRYTVQRGIIVNIVLMVLILMFAVISMNSGKMNLSPLEVLNVLLGNGTDKQNLIVFDFRLPRITLSILVGLGMGAAGVVMQSLLRNDMASPGRWGLVRDRVCLSCSSSYSSHRQERAPLLPYHYWPLLADYWRRD